MTECVYPYTGYSSAVKGNEALVTAAMWKKTLLSERSQMKNDQILYDPIYIKCSEQANPKRQKANFSNFLGLGRGGNWELSLNTDTVSVLQDEKSSGGWLQSNVNIPNFSELYT